MKVKEFYNDVQEIFGDLSEYPCWTDEETVTVGDTVTLTNSNCEFEFDNFKGSFQNNLMHCFICELEPVEMDLSNYQLEKSNNGGAYGFLDCEVKKVIRKTY